MITLAVRPQIEQVALQYGLNSALVEAIVLTESGGDPWAMRYEPGYRWMVNARTRQPFRSMSSLEAHAATAPADFPSMPHLSSDTEWTQQRTSWGLMQVMGALARELGSRDRFLSTLCDPLVGLRYGCRHLASLLAWSKGDRERAIRAYNGGRGGADLPLTEPYLRKVLGHFGSGLDP